MPATWQRTRSRGTEKERGTQATPPTQKSTRECTPAWPSNSGTRPRGDRGQSRVSARASLGHSNLQRDVCPTYVAHASRRQDTHSALTCTARGRRGRQRSRRGRRAGLRRRWTTSLGLPIATGGESRRMRLAACKGVPDLRLWLGGYIPGRCGGRARVHCAHVCVGYDCRGGAGSRRRRQGVEQSAVDVRRRVDEARCGWGNAIRARGRDVACSAGLGEERGGGVVLKSTCAAGGRRGTMIAPGRSPQA